MPVVALVLRRALPGIDIEIGDGERGMGERQGLDQLRVQTDIKNIAGATLSCQHVTEGVRWLAALWQVALQPAAAG